MSFKPRTAVIGCLVFALIAGYFVVGHYLYKVPIGLDQSGFLAGDLMHEIATQFKPDATSAMSGVALLLLSVLAIGAVGFFVTFTCRMRRRSCERTTKQNSRSNVSDGTTKKSQAADSVM